MGYKFKHHKNEKHFFNTGITSYGCKEISTENPFSCVYYCGFNLVNKGCQIILFIFHENCHLAFRIILLVSTKKNHFSFVQNMLILVDVKRMNNECCQLICQVDGMLCYVTCLLKDIKLSGKRMSNQLLLLFIILMICQV